MLLRRRRYKYTFALVSPPGEGAQTRCDEPQLFPSRQRRRFSFYLFLYFFFLIRDTGKTAAYVGQTFFPGLLSVLLSPAEPPCLLLPLPFPPTPPPPPRSELHLAANLERNSQREGKFPVIQRCRGWRLRAEFTRKPC